MIDLTVLAITFQSTVLFIVALAMLLWLWPAVRLDCFRQKMFKVRDDLFDYAASGRVSFDHPAYRLLRQSMNGFIRYGHQLSFYRFTMTWLEWKILEGRASFQWRDRWRAALGSLDDETRADLENFRDRAELHVATRMIFGSPVLIFILLVTIIVTLFHVGVRSAGDLLRVALSDTAARAIDQSILDEEAARAAA